MLRSPTLNVKAAIFRVVLGGFREVLTAQARASQARRWSETRPPGRGEGQGGFGVQGLGFRVQGSGYRA